MKHIRLRTRMVSGLCVILVGTLSIILRPDPSRWTGRQPLPAEKVESPPAVQPLAAKDSHFSLTFHIRYDLCGHEHTRQQKLSVPPDPVRLQLHYGDWLFTQKDNGYVLMRNISQLCPEHILARRENGNIFLYQNQEGGTALTAIAMFDDPLNYVHSRQTIDELNEGILFDNLEAVEQYIESLNS